MREIIINRKDFDHVDKLYDILQKELDMPEWFGKNPPALWDMLTGHCDTDCKIIFVGFNKKEKYYSDERSIKFIIETLQEAMEWEYLKGEFFFEMRDE